MRKMSQIWFSAAFFHYLSYIIKPGLTGAANRVLLITGNGERGTGNGERGTGNRERESGNECTAVIRIRIQNGGRNHGKGSGN